MSELPHLQKTTCIFPEACNLLNGCCASAEECMDILIERLLAKAVDAAAARPEVAVDVVAPRG
jgi:hypothetical protein